MVRSESGVREFLSSPSSASTPSQVIAVPDPEGREREEGECEDRVMVG